MNYYCIVLIHFFLYSLLYAAGNYTTVKPSSVVLPSSKFVTSTLQHPPLTTDWCSSIVFDSTSNVMFAHPLAFKCEDDGVWVGYPNKGYTGDTYYSFAFNKDLKVSSSGVIKSPVLLDDYGDWTVTASWQNKTFSATMGHGMPFAYFSTQSGISITCGVSPVIWNNANGTIGLTIGDRHYALFAPSGSQWTISGIGLTSNIQNKNYFSMAALPDTLLSTLQYYRRFAYNFVTDTKVQWHYDKKNSTVRTVYESVIDKKEGAEGSLLYVLYPHQWQYYKGLFTKYTYTSVRGPMKVVEGAAFETIMPYSGILPSLPLVSTESENFKSDRLKGYIDSEELKSPDQLIKPDNDTYWAGKDFGRVAQLVRIAEQVSDTTAKKYFLSTIKSKLEDWLTYTSGENAEFFYYDSTWTSLIGVKTAYDSDRHLNDHHFHYGYFVMAAAVVAQYDKAWAKEWKPMIDMVIRDADSPFRDDRMFPFLRAFDVYAGHSWASGDAAFASGNNQESTSEAINLAAGIALWGMSTGDTIMRDLGIYLYTTETVALKNYWLDIKKLVFPSNFNHTMVAIVWGEKADYGTWFSAEPEMIHGINMLPFTAASLYLGGDTQYITKNYDEIIRNNKGPINDWKDILWQFLSLSRPSEAIKAFQADSAYIPESGESKAHTYHWLNTMVSAGCIDTTITANTPSYAVFNNNKKRTYMFYNESDITKTIVFSDNYSVVAAPGVLGFQTVSVTKNVKRSSVGIRFDNVVIQQNKMVLKNNTYNTITLTTLSGKVLRMFTELKVGSEVVIDLDKMMVKKGMYVATFTGGNNSIRKIVVVK